MSDKFRSADDWWNELNGLQKDMVRSLGEMLGDVSEEDLLEVRRMVHELEVRLEITLMKLPKSKGVEAVLGNFDFDRWRVEWSN